MSGLIAFVEVILLALKGLNGDTHSAGPKLCLRGQTEKKVNRQTSRQGQPESLKESRWSCCARKKEKEKVRSGWQWDEDRERRGEGKKRKVGVAQSIVQC